MGELVYKKIEPKDEEQVKNLINKVLSNLENKQFFIAYSDWELQKLFDETYAPLDRSI